MLAAPAAAMARTVASTCSSVSVRPGSTGAMSTLTANPASLSFDTASSRRRGLGVPGSTVRHRASSTEPTDMAIPTSVIRAAATSRSMSRRINVPLVRMENGLPKSRRAARMPGISR
jgi:hypothetical protein